ncbi:hypothetical protein DFR86_05870 [Acidianus sulfidivorans JP7]|uniref:Uncharacterized protein n=1 Tax=Acidianus sulfidivorans JP7 TaxID=619593 RepID=A0A2U9IM90_9CREN|nr:hypothetical protein [Acidianus sulfidivorans]AWR97132.1 hypothetical protein DFR86_05870 [Acidianus sulfidivorans JP7]
MTKSAIRNGEEILIEIKKHGIDSILYSNGNIKIGIFDGVDFYEKRVAEEKYKIAEKYIKKALALFTSCNNIISFVYSDMVYIKFIYKKDKIMAFINDNIVSFDKDINIDNYTKEQLLNCKNKFLEFLGINDSLYTD